MGRIESVRQRYLQHVDGTFMGSYMAAIGSESCIFGYDGNEKDRELSSQCRCKFFVH